MFSLKKNKKGKDEFYLVPIYSSSIGKELPNKAITIQKPEKHWIEMDDTFSFMFSIFLDDLIGITKGEENFLGYFKGTNRTNSSITLESHDRSITKSSIGVKGLDSLKKFQVDVLGNYVEVKKEQRLSLKRSK